MITNQIRDRIHNGFQPFTIRLSDGRELQVPHRDFIAVSANVVVIIDQNEISHTINPLHIVSIGEAQRKG